MFQRLGEIVSARWSVFLTVWVLLFVGLIATAPRLEDVTRDGEFAFLPPESPSRVAEETFKEAFPDDLLSSSIVVVVRRPNREKGLIRPEDVVDQTESDFYFINKILEPRLRAIAERHGGFASDVSGEPNGEETEPKPQADAQQAEQRSVPVISRLRSPTNRTWQDVLVSKDGRAALVVLELTTEFLDYSNIEIVEEVEAVREEILTEGLQPAGLDLQISGPATVGRDMILASRESASSTERWTIILVVVLLLVIYRAPLLALIPLLTVVFSVAIARASLAALASYEIVQLFSGIEAYVTVILYGAGVDYCLFLIARYKEHLDRGEPVEEAIANALGSVGAALTASAATVMCGIGMMVFARFGKFQQAGVAITFSLAICLLAALTFTPALLRAFGRWAFWPHVPSETGGSVGGWLGHDHPLARLWERNWFEEGWRKVGRGLLAKPATIWLCSVLLLVPFATVGIAFHDYLSYGLLSELTEDAVSVEGARAVQDHFPRGFASPVTVLIEDRDFDFDSDAGIRVVRALSREILKRGNTLGGSSSDQNDSAEDRDIVDIRSVAYPIGGKRDLDSYPPAKQKVINTNARKFYISGVEDYDGHMTRLDVIFEDDPFSRGSIEQLKAFEGVLSDILDDLMPRTIYPEAVVRQMGILADGEVPEAGEVIVRVPSPTETQILVGEYDRELLDQLRERFAAIEGMGEILMAEAEEVEGLESPIFAMSLTPKSRASSEEKTGTNAAKTAPAFVFARSDDDRARTDPTPERTYKTYLIGATPSIRDLKFTTDGDQLRIDGLVLTGVFLILVILLRQPAISAYLIATVFFSYLATLGGTIVFFYALDPENFAGLDWKVPIFLFTILIAVGEDYNIFLMTRIEEEQQRLGPVDGIIEALERTGGIISSCGVIMAGTFFSLTAGTLAGMQQLGFALATGVLLDTFVVRPILVPAYLVMLNQGRFGVLGKFLGARTKDSPKSMIAEASEPHDGGADESTRR